MRLLFLTNFYPPASRGGYEQWCQEVAEGLRHRCHAIEVLTSRFGKDRLTEPDPAWVHRDLYLEMELSSLRNSIEFFTSREARKAANLARLSDLIETFKPDFVLIWGMWNLHRSLPAHAEALMPGQVVYYMGDYWPTLPSQHKVYWETAPRNGLTAIPKLALKPFARTILNREKQPELQLNHVIFPTLFMRDEFERKGVSLQQTAIIYGAIDTSLYSFNQAQSDPNPPDNLTLLYVGRLTQDKGVHTAIEALGHLAHSRGFNHLKLMIVGAGDADYEAHLRDLARKEGLESNITFTGAQPKEAMAQYYCLADVLLFTSIWPEPFGRVLVEAMASGVVVVGAATGGATEILSDNDNALTFPPGDAVKLAEQLARLIESPSLRDRLASAGRQTASQKFDIDRMTYEIESYFQTILVDS